MTTTLERPKVAAASACPPARLRADESVSVLDEESTLDALAANRQAKNLAEARDLALVVRYCSLNALPDSIDSPTGSRVPGSERMIRPGGEGSPRVREFAVADLSARMRRSQSSMMCLVADALDLRYRLPVIWRRLMAGEVEVWRARRVAEAARDLSPVAARRVDREVASLVDAIGTKRLTAIVSAAVMAADPEEAECSADRAGASRQVTLYPSSQAGTKDIFIRGAAGDVIRFDAAVDLVADLLGLEGDRDAKQIRRSKAIGVLADPLVALDLFERTADATERAAQDAQRKRGRHADRDDPAESVEPQVHDQDESLLVCREPTTDPGDAIADFDPDHPDQLATAFEALEAFDRARTMLGSTEPPSLDPDTITGAADPRFQADPSPNRPGRRRKRPRRSFPSTRLVVHMSADTFWFDSRDPCRLEDPGRPSVPITPEQAWEQLGHSRVQVLPVIDLDGMPAADAYEVTGMLRAAVLMKSAGTCPFPFCDSFSRHLQCDHTINWPDGPSAIGNLSGLDTGHHRVKTHSGWQVRQPFNAIYVWRDPHGQFYIVDHRGSRSLPT